MDVAGAYYLSQTAAGRSMQSQCALPPHLREIRLSGGALQVGLLEMSKSVHDLAEDEQISTRSCRG